MLQVKVLQVKVLLGQGMTMALKNIHRMLLSNSNRRPDTLIGYMTKHLQDYMMLQLVRLERVQGLEQGQGQQVLVLVKG